MEKEIPKYFVQLKLIYIISFDFFILFSDHYICDISTYLTDPHKVGTIKTIVPGGYGVIRDNGTCQTVQRGLLHKKVTSIFLLLTVNTKRLCCRTFPSGGMFLHNFKILIKILN